MTLQETRLLTDLKHKLQQRLPLNRLVLFGSRARGDAETDSDLDVLVVLDLPVSREVEDRVSECTWEVGLEHGIVVVPVTVSREEWDEGLLSSSLLAIAVAQEGVPV